MTQILSQYERDHELDSQDLCLSRSVRERVSTEMVSCQPSKSANSIEDKYLHLDVECCSAALALLHQQDGKRNRFDIVCLMKAFMSV